LRDRNPPCNAGIVFRGDLESKGGLATAMLFSVRGTTVSPTCRSRDIIPRVPGDPPSSSDQSALIDFLNIDLDLAFTFLKTAKIEAQDDPARSQALIIKARTALESIRHFTGQIQDRTVWQELHTRANALEAAITRLAD
jgi:hypothetical protein